MHMQGSAGLEQPGMEGDSFVNMEMSEHVQR
jgi:hypothetical protein